jgi:predicted dehydrogenase
LSSHDETRLEAVATALAPGAKLARAAFPPPDLSGFDGVILDGDQSKLVGEDVARLNAYVEDGGRIVALDAATAAAESSLTPLLGARTEERLPAGEFFAILHDVGHELLRHLPGEFPFVDAFAPLQTVNGSVKPLLEVSVHFRNRLVMAEHAIGSGSVIVSALGSSNRAFESPALVTVLRRALRRRNEGLGSRDLGVAIVGYGPLGGMGYTHGLGVQGTDGLSLTAICDTNRERLESAHEVFPEAHLHASAAEVAADPEVDVAIVATPPSTHFALALQLLRAGKHVVVEKPLCFGVAEADELIDTALANGLALSVNQNRRWDADFLTIRRAIAAGLLGDVFNVETFVGSFEHPCREWHSESSISGGAEFDWGAHYIDWTLQLLGGTPRLVYANGHKRVWQDVTNLDQVRVRMLWDDGREAEFLHSDVAAVRRPKFYIQGTEGTLVGHYRPLVNERVEPGRGYVREESHHAEAPADLTLVRYEPLGGGVREQRLTLVQPEPLAFYRNLADHLLYDDPALAVSQQSMRDLIAVLEAAHQSAERGGRPMTPA